MGKKIYKEKITNEYTKMVGNDMITKLEFYLENKKQLHISCINGIFYNGYILDLTSNKNLMVFMDKKLGEVPILFEEILRVDPFREKGE